MKFIRIPDNRKGEGGGNITTTEILNFEETYYVDRNTELISWEKNNPPLVILF